MPDAKGHGDCEACGGKCCRYIVTEIDKPTSKLDVEEIRWFLAHEHVLVYIDNGDKSWNLQVFVKCKHLDDANRCRIYPERFKVCRNYDVEDCEDSDGEVDATVFDSTEAFDAWWAERQARKRRKKERKREKKRERRRAKGKDKGGKKDKAKGKRGRRQRERAKA